MTRKKHVFLTRAQNAKAMLLGVKVTRWQGSYVVFNGSSYLYILKSRYNRVKRFRVIGTALNAAAAPAKHNAKWGRG